MVAYTFDPRTQKAEAGRSLNLRPDQSTEFQDIEDYTRNCVSNKKQATNQKPYQTNQPKKQNLSMMQNFKIQSQWKWPFPYSETIASALFPTCLHQLILGCSPSACTRHPTLSLFPSACMGLPILSLFPLAIIRWYYLDLSFLWVPHKHLCYGFHLSIHYQVSDTLIYPSSKSLTL